MGWCRWLGSAWCSAVGERGWKGVDHVGGFDGCVADALVHGEDVVAELLGLRTYRTDAIDQTELNLMANALRLFVGGM